MRKIQYIPLLAVILLVACNSGNNTSNAETINASPLAEYKAQLKYTAVNSKNNAALRNLTDTRQQSFIAPAGGVILNAVRVMLFNSTDCSYGSESQVVTMSGGVGVTFAAGTYTSTDASNRALAGRFPGESAEAFSAQSVRFDYGYNAVGDGESGWISADCINSSGIGNYDPHPPEECTDGQPCGFNRLQVVSLPESFIPAIFVTTSIFTGNLQDAAIARNPSGTFNGYTGANYLCQSDANVPAKGAGSLWKALLNTNGATVAGINYYQSDYSTFIATATGANLVGETSLVSSVSPVYALVWTGANSLNCSSWTNASDSSLGGHGSSSDTTPDWYNNGNTDCFIEVSLYCVQQSN